MEGTETSPLAGIGPKLPKEVSAGPDGAIVIENGLAAPGSAGVVDRRDQRMARARQSAGAVRDLLGPRRD